MLTAMSPRQTIDLDVPALARFCVLRGPLFAYELGLFSVGETIPLGGSTERIVELFEEPRLKSGIVGNVANCTEAKILATTGTSRDSRWYQVEVRGQKLLRGWVRATSIDTGACIG